MQQPVVGGADVDLEVLGQRVPLDAGADLAADAREGCDVVGVEIAQEGCDLVAETVVGQEAAVGVGCGGKPAGNPHAER